MYKRGHLAASQYLLIYSVLPLPPETVNSYIDKFPAIILQKIKEKFESYANKETRELDAFNFMKLYAISNLSQVPLLLFSKPLSDCLTFSMIAARII